MQNELKNEQNSLDQTFFYVNTSKAGLKKNQDVPHIIHMYYQTSCIISHECYALLANGFLF